MAGIQVPNETASGQIGSSDPVAVRDYLQARINPSVVTSLEARLRLAWPGNELNFELKQGQLTWLEAGGQVHATFWFRDAQDVGHLLSSSDSAYVDFMQRFMAAELSSDGYLPWAFTLLSLFRGGPNMVTPA